MVEPSARSTTEPGRAPRSAIEAGVRRTDIHWGPSSAASKSSRNVTVPGRGVSSTGSNAGQPSSPQVTVVTYVSRPSAENARVMLRGRTPRSTSSQSPSGPCTRSPCPVFWIGRSVPRAVSSGLPGAFSNGPSGLVARATLTLWPRSVPPSAITRYHQSPMRYRCGASGNWPPTPDQMLRGSSSARPDSRSTRACSRPRCFMNVGRLGFTPRPEKVR